MASVRHIASTSSSARTASTIAGHSSVTMPSSNPPAGAATTATTAASAGAGSGAASALGCGGDGGSSTAWAATAGCGCASACSRRSILACSARARVYLGAGGLRQGELELRAGVGTVAHRLHRRCEQIEDANCVGMGDARGLLGQALVAVGGDRDLRRHAAERVHHEQLARV